MTSKLPLITWQKPHTYKYLSSWFLLVKPYIEMNVIFHHFSVSDTKRSQRKSLNIDPLLRLDNFFQLILLMQFIRRKRRYLGILKKETL